MYTIKVVGIGLSKPSFHLVAHDYSAREQCRKQGSDYDYINGHMEGMMKMAYLIL